MELVVITSPGSIALEMATILEMLERGLGYVHVRKPNWTAERTAAWLKEVPYTWYPQLTLHGHSELAKDLGLGGMHFRETDANYEGVWQGRMSRSFHQFDEVKEYRGPTLEYGFISPIWPSLSKQGYAPVWQREALLTFLQAPRRFPLYGLGGVTPGRLAEAYALGLDGVAVLGGIWQEPTVHQRVQAFEQYQVQLDEIRTEHCRP